MRNRLFPLIAIPLFSFASAIAQDLATLTITVADPSGAVVPGASIVLLDLHRGTIRKSETGSSGFLSYDSLQAGEYSLEVEKAGFNKYRLNSFNLNLRDRQTLRVELKIAPPTGATIFVADRPGIVSNDATQGVSLSQDYVETLPVNGRSAENLILLAPGVTSVTGSASGGFNTNGLRSNANYYTLDGVSVNRSVSVTGGSVEGGMRGAFGDPGSAAAVAGGSVSTELITIDAMQEMRVQTSSFAPEFGRSPGAQVVMSSRNGFNGYHGSLYEYLRNDRFDANDWFANASGFHRARERQNRPGGTFGGQIQKDKMFFFLAFEHLNLDSPNSLIVSVPNAATRAAASVALRPFFNAFPIANGPALDAYTSQFRTVVSNPSSSNFGSVRLDRIINSTTTAFLRASYTPSKSQQRGADLITPNVITNDNARSQLATFGLTKSFANGKVNDLRVNYSKYVNQADSQMDSYGGAIPLNDAIVFPKGTTAAVGSFTLNALGVAGYTYANRTENDQQQFNVVDSLSRTIGAHQLKFGGDYRRLNATNVVKPFSEGIIFNGLGGGIDSLTSGIALNAQVGTHTTSVYPTYNNISAYAQDVWRLTQWTTVTYGLRYDINPAPTARSGQQPFALASSNIAGVTQNDPLYKTRYFDVAPRFGIAYNMDERRGREMTIRAGLGIYYDLGYGATSSAFNGAPYANIRTISSVAFPLTLANLAAPGLPPVRPYGQVFSADTNLQSPLVTEWNVTLDRNVGIGQTLSIGYTATLGRRLSRIETRPTFSDAYDILTAATNGATSNYNGIQVQFRKRLSAAFQAQLSYTYSHSIDTASSDTGFTGGFASLFGAGERGSSDYDVRHNLNFSGSYRLPAPAKGKMYIPIRDWFLDFVATARTGLPFDIQGVSTTTSSSSTTSGVVGLFAQVRPNYLGQAIYIDDPKAPGGRRINIATFTIPTGYQQGNLGRNALRGFSAEQLDLALRKTISIGERVKIHLGLQGYNITNHPNFANVSNFEGGNMSSPNFGVVTRMQNQSFGAGGISPLYRAGGPRSMEVSIRIQF